MQKLLINNRFFDLVSPVRNSPATIEKSRITAIIHTTAITTMIATSTTTPGRLTSFPTQ